MHWRHLLAWIQVIDAMHPGLRRRDDCATLTRPVRYDTMRRTLLRTIIAIVTIVGCAPPPRLASLPNGAQIERFTIGALEAIALKDGDISIDNDGETLGLGASRDAVSHLLIAAGLPPDHMRVSIQPLLVRDGAHLMLFDVGVADVDWADSGRLVKSMVLAGFEPRDVTDIFITHAHLDHVGELATATGGLAFANAVIHMSAPEWAVMHSDAWSCVDMNPRARSLPALIAPRIVTFEPGAQILPSVRAVPTPGHTPGHSGYEIASGDAKLLVIGDIAHHYVLSLERPELGVVFDIDGPAAVAVRQSVLATLAHDGERVYSFHFPFPGLGHVIAQGNAYAWIPER